MGHFFGGRKLGENKKCKNPAGGDHQLSRYRAHQSYSALSRGTGKPCAGAVLRELWWQNGKISGLTCRETIRYIDYKKESLVFGRFDLQKGFQKFRSFEFLGRYLFVVFESPPKNSESDFFFEQITC